MVHATLAPVIPRSALAGMVGLVLTATACSGSFPGLQPVPVVPAGGRGGIAGFVRDEAGRPIPGAFVGASCQMTDIAIMSNEQGWYDLGQAGLAPGPCSIKGGTPDGLGFFGEVVVIAGTSQRLDFIASG